VFVGNLLHIKLKKEIIIINIIFLTVAFILCGIKPAQHMAQLFRNFIKVCPTLNKKK